MYCDSSSQNFDSGVVSANFVWEPADWDIGVDCIDGLFTNWKKQVDCISNELIMAIYSWFINIAFSTLNHVFLSGVNLPLESP